MILSLPTLYKKASTGKIQVWKIWVDWVGDNPAIFTEHGVQDGAMQLAEDVIREGKNIGKANETTPMEQAEFEAKAKWVLKKRKNHYVESVEEAQAGAVDSAFVAGGVAPMLAHKFHEQGHKIVWPAFVQPKLDGHRCIAMIHDGKCTLWSRTQKPITGLPHIQRALEKLAATSPNGMDITLDGELYNHDLHDQFEKLASNIRSEKPKPGSEIIQYWIYDVVVDLPFAERNALLQSIETLVQAYDLTETLAVLPTFEAADKDAMLLLFSTFLEHNYEGAMVRNAKGKYSNRRSYDLQKVKEFDDAEFEIIGVEEGRGAMAGRAIFVCRAENGESFNVKMKGDLDNLTKVWDNRDDYLGRVLTVQYFGLSAYGIPRFPVGLRLREDV